MTVFENAFRVVIGEEGGFTANAADPGNWTGGRCGSGRCAGTKYGISAASYPTVDIAGLSLEDARAIYRRDYWDRVHGDNLPPALALLAFDAAVNSGPDRAVRWLQSALKVGVDGVIGPLTLAAARNCNGQGAAVVAEYQAQRLVFMARLPTWRSFGLGWARRVCRIQLEALMVAGPN
jgi:lysozyme family protein